LAACCPITLLVVVPALRMMFLDCEHSAQESPEPGSGRVNRAS